MRDTIFEFAVGTVIVVFVCVLGGAALWGCPTYYRYQARMNAQNDIAINSLKIQQTQQLVEVEVQKARIKTAEAKGISRAQHIINATLTDRYLQHEAINAQERMAGSPNHTQIYIPVGTNGIPLVKTISPSE